MRRAGDREGRAREGAGEVLERRQVVAAQGGDRLARLVEPGHGEVVRALEPVDHLRVGIAVARQQPRALELQGEGGERVREHVVQLARDAAALGQRGGLGVRGARIAQLLDVRARAAGSGA